MGTLGDLPAAVRRNLVILFGAGLGFWVSLTSLLPVLPAYIEDLGAPPQGVGMVMGSFAIGLLLCRFSLGRLADRHSRRLVLWIGLAVVAIAPWGYLFAHTLPTLMVVRAFHGISVAALTTAYGALVTDLAPPAQRGEIIGYMSLALSLGLTIGPSWGSGVQAQAGYPAVFISSGILGGLGFCLSLAIREERRSPVSPTPVQGLPWWRILQRRSVGVPFLMLLLVGTAFGTLITFLPLYLRTLGAIPLGIGAWQFNPGLFYTIAAIASFISRIAVGKASDRWGRGPFILGSMASYGLCMGLLAISHHVLGLILAALAEGLGTGILIPMVLALLSDRFPPQERGTIYAVSFCGFDLGVPCGGVILGGLVETWGYRPTFGLALGITLMAVAIFALTGNTSPQRSLAFALGQAPDQYSHREETSPVAASFNR